MVISTPARPNDSEPPIVHRTAMKVAGENRPVPDVHAVGGSEVEEDQQQDRSRQQPRPTAARRAPEVGGASPKAPEEQAPPELIRNPAVGVETYDRLAAAPPVVSRSSYPRIRASASKVARRSCTGGRAVKRRSVAAVQITISAISSAKIDDHYYTDTA
jgi:hypothetical protein